MTHGLCDDCLFARPIATRRSNFLFCERSRREPERYPRYPRVPVVRCAGHAPRGPRDGRA